MSKTNITVFDINEWYKPKESFPDFDPGHEYVILVPINDDVAERMYRYQLYDNEGNISDDFFCLKFNEDTYNEMEPYFFFPLNDKFDIWISMYEEEVIWTENLDEAIDLTQTLLDNIDNQAAIEFGKIMLSLMKKAKELNTVTGFYF